jgi:hypothetical protein
MSSLAPQGPGAVPANQTASDAASTASIIGQINANAQQSLQLSEAQSQAAVTQAAGQALTSGAAGIKDAAKTAS